MQTDVPKIPDDYLEPKYKELEYQLKISLIVLEILEKAKKKLGREKETKDDTMS
jgi:hypothetical protein